MASPGLLEGGRARASPAPGLLETALPSCPCPMSSHRPDAARPHLTLAFKQAHCPPPPRCNGCCEGEKNMFSYTVGLLACVFVFYNPLMRFLSTSPPRIVRTPRPPLNSDMLALESPNETNLCKPDGYRVHVFSREPLVLYIEDFLTRDERQHLLEIRCATLIVSLVPSDRSSARPYTNPPPSPTTAATRSSVMPPFGTRRSPSSLAPARRDASRTEPGPSRAGATRSGWRGFACSATDPAATTATTLTGAWLVADGGE